MFDITNVFRKMSENALILAFFGLEKYHFKKIGQIVKWYIKSPNSIKTTLNLLKSSSSNIFNCGYGSGYSVKEVITEMENIVKNKLRVEIGPRRPKDIAVSVANSDKFKKKFNWKPRFNNLNIILSSALNWEKNNL